MHSYYEENDEYIICPKCGGSGKDNAMLDWKCWDCDGLGRVKVDKNQKDKEQKL